MHSLWFGRKKRRLKLDVFMENPYQGNAVIEDTLGGVEITIPSKQNLFVTLFLCFWLCGWATGEFFVIAALLGLTVKGELAVSPFLLAWLAAWTIGGVFIIRFVLWSLRGKEIITIGKGELTIDKKAALFYKPKTYDLNQGKNFRCVDDSSGYYGAWGRRGGNSYGLDNTGIIKFDYGMKTIRFGGNIDEAEGNYLLQKLREKKILTENNFCDN
jgi:hypothetical protein